jgi:N-acetylglucosaminyldiphosphoundecaprenol N-acetyl-beta-D-mannosaminyltransferase
MVEIPIKKRDYSNGSGLASSKARELPMDHCSSSLQVLGVRFDNLTTSEAADRVEEFIRNGCPKSILARNAAIRVLEDQDPWLQGVYENSDLVTVDGMAFVYLGRILGTPFKEMTGGPALWYEILRRAALKGYRVFFLGAREDILQAAVSRLQQRYPGLQVAGCHNGYFKPENEEQVVEAIRQSRAQILMVGMSSPMKERFQEKYLHRLEVPACIGVGGAIDLFAGIFHLAPTWMRVLCLEWLYRVWQEPRRLVKRYLISNGRFLHLIARQLIIRGMHRRVGSSAMER